MNSYKLKWRVLSPYSTPPQSDTIFGHIAWAIVYLYGGSRLEKILARLREAPDLVCSSLVPEGRLPIPLLPMPVNIREQWADRKTGLEGQRWKDWARLQKELKKLTSLPETMLTGPDSVFKWLDVILKLETELAEDKSKKDRGRKATVFHNTINRLTCTTDESTGGPYAEVASWEPDGTVMNSWIDCAEDLITFAEWEQVCEYMSESGFGKNKSTGRGRMDIRIEPFTWHDKPRESNAWMLISNMLPSTTDSTDCYYGGLAKFPRMGGGFAQTNSPFKYPVYVLTPGSVFHGGKKPVGTLLRGIHPDLKDVVQNLYAYSIPIRIEEDL